MTTFYSKHAGFVDVNVDVPGEYHYFQETDNILASLKELNAHVTKIKWDLEIPHKHPGFRAYMALGADLNAVINCFESVFRNQYEPDGQQLSLDFTSGGNTRGKSKGTTARA